MTQFGPAFDQLGFGAAPIAGLYRALDARGAEATVHAAWEAGCRYFDTAPHYGLGLSEERLGAALAHYPRDEYVISTKVGRLLVENPHRTGSDLDNGFDNPDDLMRVRDDSARGIRESLERSLERLGLDHVDILLVHDPEENFEQASTEGAAEVARLKAEGLVQAWGVGTKYAEVAQAFLAATEPDLVMLAGRYTLLEQASALPLLAECHERAIGVIAVGVFNSGVLATDPPNPNATYEYGQAPAQIVNRAAHIAQICARHQVPTPAAAIQFPRRHPAVVNVTVGARTADEITADAALAAHPIPEQLWSELTDAGLIHKQPR